VINKYVLHLNKNVACNAVLQYPQGVYTLRNYGRRINCTISIIFPESFRILSSSVGAQDKRIGSVLPVKNLLFESGIIKKVRICNPNHLLHWIISLNDNLIAF